MSFSEDPKPVSHQVKETKVIYVLDVLFLNTSYDVSDCEERDFSHWKIRSAEIPPSIHTQLCKQIFVHLFPLASILPLFCFWKDN